MRPLKGNDEATAEMLKDVFKVAEDDKAKGCSSRRNKSLSTFEEFHLHILNDPCTLDGDNESSVLQN